MELNKQFDVSGPLGFHITGHLLALAALIVACFAITGYITFRGDSIDGNKVLEDGSVGPNKIAPNVAVMMPGVKRQTYSYTYPQVAARGTAGDSIGPFMGAAATNGDSELALVSIYVQQTSLQTNALGAIRVERGSAANCAVDSQGGDGNATNQVAMFTSAANTVDETYEIQPFSGSQAIGFSPGSEQLCLCTDGNTGVVVAGGIVVTYVLEHGPGGSFPVPLAGTVLL